MPTSIRKIIANRKNSKKSTGPITNKGKLKSSLNSIKHGLYGEKIAIIGETLMRLMILLSDWLKS